MGDSKANLQSQKSFVLISGTSNRPLAESIARHLGVQLCAAEIDRFPNGETRVEILESVRGKDVYVVQSTCPPVNDNIMELLLIIDALRRSSASTITAVVPYFGYSKQDKKKTGREPISAKVVADLLAVVGVQRLVTMDLHVPQIEGFFNIPVDNLSPLNLIADYIRKKGMNDLVIVAPDAGGVKRARNLANLLDARLAIIDKYRKHFKEADAMNVVGKVKDLNAVIIDDFIDTGSSIVEAVKALRNHEVKSIIVACTHPIHTEPATQRLKESDCDEIIVTDTIQLGAGKMFDRIKVLSVDDMLARTIAHIHNREPVAYLFHQHK
ncbi:ribose-phosphate pyrophosphokinase [Candidatus Woesearchaeota archaeon]|nr:ribose-phosphate pyrophosphokinase [Candidatus Woesearchaeota archaeon]